jgi:hypothetical protein
MLAPLDREIFKRIAGTAAAPSFDLTRPQKCLADTAYPLIVAVIAEYGGGDLRGRKARSLADNLLYLVYQHGPRVACTHSAEPK